MLAEEVTADDLPRESKNMREPLEFGEFLQQSDNVAFIARPSFADRKHRSHRDRSLDVRVRLIVLQREVFIFETENVFHRWVQLHGRQRIGPSRKLFARLVQMIEIQMGVAESVDEFSR